MNSELIINVQPSDISIAITENNNLVEYQKESREMTFSVGNIYLGRVKKMMPGLNACFVDIGSEKEAFLHYQDLGAQFTSTQKFLKRLLSNKKRAFPFAKAELLPEHNDPNGGIASLIQQGDELLVQVTKEPISTKGPRLTCELSYAGRYLVLIPFSDKVSISTKIKSSEEKARLRQLIQSIKPKNCGVIVRTVAEGKRVEELDSELSILYHRWEESLNRTFLCNKPPTLIYEETSRSIALLRDLLNPSYQSIHVNDEKTYNEIKEYVSIITPEHTNIVKLYRGELPIFDNFGITKQIKSSFGRVVSYKSGAYLIIEHTEALHVVDVNSGHRIKATNQEANALEVNLGAADELARQLRLRDMGGIIVVDFIDMNLAEDKQKLYERMCQNMQRDRAKHTILPLSKFGLMQITRQRVRAVINVPVDETCPSCFGKGSIQPSILLTDKLEHKMEYITNELKIRNFTLYIHPFIEAYITKGFISLKRRWRIKFGMRFKIIPSQELPLLSYKFIDNITKDEIDVKEEYEIV